MKVNVKGVSYEIVDEFDVYHCGWECDSTGWVVKDGEEIKLVLSNHGSNFFAKESHLKDFICDYEKAIYRMKVAIELLAGTHK